MFSAAQLWACGIIVANIRHLLPILAVVFYLAFTHFIHHRVDPIRSYLYIIQERTYDLAALMERDSTPGIPINTSVPNTDSFNRS